jgi:predicted transglutaminase-like cysteine proteinase
LTNFKAQGQTFEHLVIDLHQSPKNLQLNMHNIYVTLSCLRSLNGLVILRNITIQDIHKANFKKGSLDMTIIPVVMLDIEKTITPKCFKEKKQMQHEVCKSKNDKIIEINDNLNDAMNNDDVIHYWHEEFQLTKEDETYFLIQMDG